MSVAVERLIDGPASAERTVILAHGAGAPMDHPALTAIAHGVAEHGVRVEPRLLPVRAQQPLEQAAAPGPADPATAVVAVMFAPGPLGLELQQGTDATPGELNCWATSVVAGGASGSLPPVM